MGFLKNILQQFKQSNSKPLRSTAEQQGVDEQCRSLCLYYFPSCPFCVKVLHVITQLHLNMEMKDILKNEDDKNELIQKGGKKTVPCLRITSNDGSFQWMYESEDIITYLQQNFS